MATTAPESIFPASANPESPAIARGLLRFSTAGSVDDGKSTLIGRLLYDSRAIYDDQMDSVRASKVNRSGGPIDFSLLTDGLRAEREQGITIDVAYRYFSTLRRKFIIADTPGHEQYTRNMATGASTAEASVVLIDATKGVLPQSRRHACIASLLGVHHIVAAVNKMDLAGYSQEVFECIAREFRAFAQQLQIASVYAVPVSALEGDNVVRRSPRMNWFDGPALLEYLESLPVESASAESPLRFPVQYVIRPDAGFRGFAGQLASGVLRNGTEVVALPSGIKTRVKSISGFDGETELAQAGRSTCITLEDEIDISRGDMLASTDELPRVSNEFEATLVWMHASPLDTNKVYLLKHTTRSIRARIKRIRHRIDVNTLAHVPATGLDLNEIASVEVHTTLPLYFDAYRQNRVTGSFILIDPTTNATVAGGVIERESEPSRADSRRVDLKAREGRITPSELAFRYGHAPGAVWLPERPRVAEVVERALFDEGWHVLWTGISEIEESEIIAFARALRLAGLVAIFSPAAQAGNLGQEIRELYGAAAFFETSQPGETDEELAARILKDLRRWRGASSHSRKGKP